MPTLRISFPGKDAPTTLVLKGRRITVGRQPHNTIQIVDRTVSGAHAELLAEPDGHYRLHDLDSTNGTFVAGQAISDYHLGEPCRITFGTVDCEFDSEALGKIEIDEAESLATRAEVESLRHLNSGLHANIDRLCEEIDALKRLVKTEGAENSPDQLKAELHRIVLERGELREAEHRRVDEIARLKHELALLRRDRDNLQNALKASALEVERLKGAPSAAISSAPTEAPSVMPVAPAPEAAPAALVRPVRAPAAPSGVTPLPLPVKPFPGLNKPSIPLATRPTAILAASTASVEGLPPDVAKPIVKPTTLPANRPAPHVIPRATSPAPTDTPPPKVSGPTGTQRIPLPASFSASGSPTAALGGAKAVPKVVPAQPVASSDRG